MWQQQQDKQAVSALIAVQLFQAISIRQSAACHLQTLMSMWPHHTQGDAAVVPLVEVAVQQQDGKKRRKHHLSATQHLEHCSRRSSNRKVTSWHDIEIVWLHVCEPASQYCKRAILHRCSLHHLSKLRRHSPLQ